MKTATANNFVAIILIIVSSFVSVLHAEELARNTKTKNTPEESNENENKNASSILYSTIMTILQTTPDIKNKKKNKSQFFINDDCSDLGLIGTCEFDSDCPEYHICSSEGYCAPYRPTCLADTDCEDGYTCEEEFCIPLESESDPVPETRHLLLRKRL